MLKILMIAGLLQTPPPPAPTPTPATLVFPTAADLVHVDAIVVDKEGRQVTDLSPSDFLVEVEGKRIIPSIAKYIPLADEEAADAIAAAEGERPPGRVIAFLVAQPLITYEPSPGRDAVSNRRVRLSAVDRVNRLLRTYVVTQLGPRDVAAVVNADHPRSVAIRFRDDPEALARDVEELHDDALGSERSLFLPASALALTVYGREVIRISRSLVDEMRRLPGRRILVIVSSDLVPSDSRTDPLGVEGRELIDAANRAGVTIYGVSPGGASSRFSEVLGALAHDTGGSSVQGTNGIEDGFSRIMERNRGYYLLGYDPGRGPGQAAHKVKVTVLRPGLEVAARPLVFDRNSLALANTRPDPGDGKDASLVGRYRAAIDRYRVTGDPSPSPGEWTSSDLKRLADRASKDPSIFDLEAATLLHLQREMRARDQSSVEGAPDCDVGPDARVVDRLAEIARGQPAMRDFAIRFHVAASFRYRAMHCYEHAWYWAEEGRKAFPDDATLLMTRGLVDEALGSQDAQTAVRLGSFAAPRPSLRSDPRADTAFRRERLVAARAMFERVVLKVPDFVDARLHFGRVLFRLGQYERARIVLEDAAAQADERSLFLGRLFAGEAIEALGEMEAALVHYRAAFAQLPFSKSAAMALSFACEMTGSTEEAKTVLKAYLENPDRKRYVDPLLVYLSGVRSEADDLIRQNLRTQAAR